MLFVLLVTQACKPHPKMFTEPGVLQLLNIVLLGQKFHHRLYQKFHYYPVLPHKVPGSAIDVQTMLRIKIDK